MTVQEILASAKAAAPSVGQASTDAKNLALTFISEILLQRSDLIISANQQDLANGVKSGLAQGLMDRLMLNHERIQGLANAIADVISLPDPVGEAIEGKILPNGLSIQKIRVPFGVIGCIYEARPNVTFDIAALAIKSGNAIVLRGGTAAENTNRVLVEVLRDGLIRAGLDGRAAQTVDEFGRDGAKAMMQARGLVDVLIPRGSANLIRTVVEESKVPVIETGDGVVHMFLDDSADAEMAVSLVVNAKTQRVSVCNALETLLIHVDAAERLLPFVAKALKEKNVTIHGCPRTLKLVPDAVAATEEDWSTEYYSLDLSVRIVDNLDQALSHISKYSTHHTESIVTNSVANSERFLSAVDSAVVMVNASTRFTDGGEFGFGAEVGISTQKLHARGPMGLRELTSSKWLVRGSGQVRK